MIVLVLLYKVTLRQNYNLMCRILQYVEIHHHCPVVTRWQNMCQILLESKIKGSKSDGQIGVFLIINVSNMSLSP